jgi:hypothetical protein
MLSALDWLSVRPCQIASELPSCGYRVLVGLSRYMPTVAFRSFALAAALSVAALDC